MLKRFLKFGIVGGFGTIINITIFAILNFAGINYIISSIIAFIIAATSNYILNQIWVFSDRGHKASKTLWLKFMYISIFSLNINIIVLYFMEKFIMPKLLTFYIPNKIILITANILNTNTINKITTLYSQCIGIGFSMIFNFIGNNYITFKKK